LSGAISRIHVENAAKAKRLYSAKIQPDDQLADWHFAKRNATRLIAQALRDSDYLYKIASALDKNCGHGLAFRYLLAPPVSQDQFKLLCPEWSKSAENGAKPARASAARAAEAVILARLDPKLVKWVKAARRPTRRELRLLFEVVGALLAQQRLATARRSRLAFDQEQAVIKMLQQNGWSRRPSTLVATGASVPPKHFMHKVRFATKTRPQEVDIACGLGGTNVLAMECKVTNDETNSVKRINDVLKKAAAWKDHWGNFIRTAALLEGVVAAKDVQRLEDAGVEVFWSHDLSAFENWLATQNLGS